MTPEEQERISPQEWRRLHENSWVDTPPDSCARCGHHISTHYAHLNPNRAKRCLDCDCPAYRQP